MKTKRLNSFLLCILICMLLAAPAFAVEEAEGQLILDKYTAEDQLGQPRQIAIREFEGTVTEEEVPEEVLKKVSQYSSFTIRALNINGIHVLDLYKDDGKNKPLVIYIHGGGQSKTTFFIENAEHQKNVCGTPAFSDYAKAGFRVITFDTPGHGDDDTGPRSYLEVMAEGVHYIDRLIEYFNTVEDADATRFALQGFSLGANTTFAYVAHGYYKPRVIIADSAVVDLTTVPNGPLYDCIDHSFQGRPHTMTREQIRTFAKRYSPCLWPDKFADVYILSGSGKEDDVHPPKSLKDFEKTLKEMGYKNFKFVYESNHGHWPTDYTIQNSTLLLKKKLLK